MIPARRLKSAAVLALTALLLAAPPAPALNFVTQNNGQFREGNRLLRFIGYHLRGICHYGEGDVLPYSYTGDRATNLDLVQTVGGRVIRAFVASRDADPVETGDRLQIVLDMAAARNIYVICALTDYYKGTGMHPQGDDVYYTDPGCCGGLLGDAFYTSGYTVNYLPQALYLANRFKDHPAVFSWEIGNELRNPASVQHMLNFCLDVAAQIRAVDPNHMISSGFVGWNWTLGWNEAITLYNQLDFLTNHPYNGTDQWDDSDLASLLNKPFIIEEAGFDSGDRAALINNDVAKWINRGASGYIQWGLMATPYDNGDGDTAFGVDIVFHASDWSAILNVYANWAAALAVNGPWIDRHPDSLADTVTQGTNAPTQSFTIANGGDGVMTYTIQDNRDWLATDPTGGDVATETDTIDVIFTTATLAPGTYNGTVTITAPDADNTPQTIAVTVYVDPVAPDFDEDGDVDLVDYGYFLYCYNGPANPPNDDDCVLPDFDDDGDVDLSDYGVFLSCYNGPNAFPACN
jgi:hypothetical protein